MMIIKTGIQLLELTPTAPPFLIQMSNDEIIALTTKENFGIGIDENMKEKYGDYLVNYLN